MISLRENMKRFKTKNLNEQKAIPGSGKTFAHDDMQKRVYDALNAKGIVTDEPTGNTDIKDVESGMGTVQVGDYTHVAYIDLKKYDAALGIGTKSNWGADNSEVSFDIGKLLKKPILIARSGWNNALPSDNKTMIPISSIKSHLIGAGVIEKVTYRAKGFAKFLVLSISDQMNPKGGQTLLKLGINPETGAIAQIGMPFGPKGYQQMNHYGPAGSNRNFYVLGITENEQGRAPRTTIRKTTQGQRIKMGAKGEPKVYTG